MTVSPENSQPKEQLFVLLAYLYHRRFCRDRKVQSKNIDLLNPGYFYAWLKNYMEQPPEDPQLICQKLDIGSSVWDRVERAVRTGEIVAYLFTEWPALFLSGRPAFAVRLKKVTIACVLFFADGTVLPIQSVTEVLDSNRGLFASDAFIASLLREASEQIIDRFAQEGIEKLHERGVLVDDKNDLIGRFIGFAKKHFLTQTSSDEYNSVCNLANVILSVFNVSVPHSLKDCLTEPESGAKESNWNF